ncbi:hypothetical protein N7462_004747 [Penicillium macrosclerotiorum]|uniref:uncharacterized protein n=1 Tax=Penicillium macrosclerotiorum TaxID=303699 RepID=UPI002548B326|nr:uncharacterized protein N7462_004747 [Penicillium macrosclerotiorum]KAJ5690355.1 hypothetical protein N7462_004747 [Penicillium macrosclerotiorum]
MNDCGSPSALSPKQVCAEAHPGFMRLWGPRHRRLGESFGCSLRGAFVTGLATVRVPSLAFPIHDLVAAGWALALLCDVVDSVIDRQRILSVQIRKQETQKIQRVRGVRRAPLAHAWTWRKMRVRGAHLTLPGGHRGEARGARCTINRLSRTNTGALLFWALGVPPTTASQSRCIDTIQR